MTATTTATCSASDCDRPVRSRGMCVSHYNKAHYQANAEKARARARAWALANPERRKAHNQARDKTVMAAMARRWYRTNRLRAIANAANRKARQLGVSGVLTAEGIAARFDYFAGRCWICTQPGADSIDHVKPLAKRGLNTHSNIRPAHLGCNAARSWEGRR